MVDDAAKSIPLVREVAALDDCTAIAIDDKREGVLDRMQGIVKKLEDQK
jgi:hypothetical protein